MRSGYVFLKGFKHLENILTTIEILNKPLDTGTSSGRLKVFIFKLKNILHNEIYLLLKKSNSISNSFLHENSWWHRKVSKSFIN